MTEDNFLKHIEDKIPSPHIVTEDSSVELIANLQLISEVFQKIEEETIDMADEIFDYLINISDEDIANGTIPSHANGRVNKYIKILNRLFALSRKKGTFRIISRNTVENLDKKTFAISMCHDGGVSLDILCDIVNTENQARIPNNSPVKVTVKKLFLGKGRDH